MKIKILTDIVVNQIAAGEVVDRPVAIVRELVDNSVDAGAHEIRVRIEHGGHSLIAIHDDGIGMSRDDAVLAFERHATSKIQSAADLQRISTRGFRGEALAAIAAVSKVTVRTRERDAEHGTELNIEGGKLRDVRACACSPGTLIEVRAIFFNTTARRKFLRSPRVEEARIKSWLEAAALGTPEVHVRFVVDEKERLNIPPSTTSIERARQLYRGNSVVIDHTTELATIRGLILHPQHAEGQRNALAILVNGRLVSDRMLARAVKEGFGAILREREFPCGVVSVEVPPPQVDVNVHPQKSEVRFQAGQAIFGIVRSAVKKAVEQFRSPIPAREISDVFERRVPSTYNLGGANSQLEGVAQSLPLFSRGAMPAGISPNSESASEQQYPFRFSELVFRGQIFECYLLCEWNDLCVIVDMHAAHERCNFNRVLTRIRERAAVSQALLIPEEVPVNAVGVEELREFEPLLQEAGYQLRFDEADQNQIRVFVESVPALLLDGRAVEALVDIVQNSDGMGNQIDVQIEKIAARIACHASIRSGKILSSQEVSALFADLDASLAAGHCPHGRPVATTLRRTDFERLFGRDE